MKRIFIFVFFIIFTGFSCQISTSTPYSTPLTVGDKNILVEIVNTQEKMQLGLSGREKLTDKQGMLFDFGSPAPRSFWMKDMKFDIDIIWIQNKKIVGITANVPAPVTDNGFKIKDLNLPTYPSPLPADMVLEVNAGWSKKNNIKINDTVDIKE